MFITLTLLNLDISSLSLSCFTVFIKDFTVSNPFFRRTNRIHRFKHRRRHLTSYPKIREKHGSHKHVSDVCIIGPPDYVGERLFNIPAILQIMKVGRLYVRLVSIRFKGRLCDVRVCVPLIGVRSGYTHYVHNCTTMVYLCK